MPGPTSRLGPTLLFARTVAKVSPDRPEGDAEGVDKNPDYRIEGQTLDNVAPTSNLRNIASRIQEKVEGGQADRIVLNLADSHVDLDAMRAQLRDRSIEGLREATVIGRNGNVIDFGP